MTVVRNEFERGQNRPSGVLDEHIWATAYHAHPYHHSTIGWKADIENVSIERLKEFYDTFYWPNNATATVVGDFEEAEALAKIKNILVELEKAAMKYRQFIQQNPSKREKERLY